MARAALSVLVALAGCSPGEAPASARAPRAASLLPQLAVADARGPDAAPPSCVDDGAPFDPAVLRDRVARLASPELDGRAPGTAGDASARAIIAERFRCLGLTPAGGDETFAQPFAADGAPTANVVGYVAGTDAAIGSEIVLVGEHHDHLGGGLLGANDNASGVAALLAIAQAVRQHGATRRTVAFVTFGGEELGLVGSTHFVTHPPAALPLDHVVQFINLDMVGSHASHDAVAAFGAFPGAPTSKMLARLATRYRKLHVAIGGHSVRGDQVGFCKADIPYVFLWTPDDRCYHQACDTADHIDYPRMVDIASLAGDLVLELADTDVDLAKARARRGCHR